MIRHYFGIKPCASPLAFTNQGPQIPEAQLNAIFEKFYRLDSARSSSTGGAGLGLAIAKEIVTAHKGTISASSGPEGTVFTIELPGSPAAPSQEEGPARAGAAVSK